MALLGREFIAVPDDRKGQIVFKWPDITIRRFTRAIVNADEMAMFVNTGQVVQTLGPGRHQIDANEFPASARSSTPSPAGTPTAPSCTSSAPASTPASSSAAGSTTCRTRGPAWS